MPVEIRNAQKKVRLDLARLRRDAQRMLEAVEAPRKLLSVLLTDDRGMAELHARWMGEGSATDVLSFPMGEEGILGDVAISVEWAARRGRGDAQGQVLRYLTHGILHLAGYDHRTPAQWRRMSRRARRLMREVKG